MVYSRKMMSFRRDDSGGQALGDETFEDGYLRTDQSSSYSHMKKDIFEKIMKNGAFFVFTACSESL